MLLSAFSLRGFKPLDNGLDADHIGMLRCNNPFTFNDLYDGIDIRGKGVLKFRRQSDVDLDRFGDNAEYA